MKMPPTSKAKKLRRLKAYKSHETRRRSKLHQYEEGNTVSIVPTENCNTEYDSSNSSQNIENPANSYVTTEQIGPNISIPTEITSTSKNDDNFLNVTDDSAPLIVETEDSSTETRLIKGRRIININNFYANLQKISKHGPFGCGLASVEIVSEKQIGYKSKFTFQCKLCNSKFYIDSDEGSDMDINNCAVLGTVASGCGESQLQELSAAMELPLITNKLYSKCHSNIANMWDKISTKTMIDAGLEEKMLAIKEGRISINGIPLVDVIVDGCWSKRSYKKNYSALSGAAVIIGKKTGKILYLGVKNKYCSICAIAQYKNMTPNEHKCFKNYTGSSTGMESSILVEGFKCSVSMHGLIYERMINDGDSSTYSKIIETRPYQNITVQKIECKNHIMRNLCNKLMQLKTDTKYPVRFRKNITDNKIISIRSTIKKSINHLTSQCETEKRAHTEILYGDILQAHIHAFGDHNGCKTYFCNKKDKAQDIAHDLTGINEFKLSGLWAKICQIISNVASHAPSLIHNVESNKAENFNSIIAKLVGGKRINFSLRGSYENRCKGAAISYNTKKLLSMTYKCATGKSPSGKIKQLEKRRNKNKQKKTIRIRRKINMESKDNNIDYGENCQKVDLPSEIMEKEKESFLKTLRKTEEERKYIERQTILQSGCSEWLELRRKLLTASNFGRIIKRRPTTNCSNIVKELIYKQSISHIKAIKHGTENEKKALEALSNQLSLKISPCGLFLDKDIPYLGASPDGIIAGDDMIVEVKCPLSAYNMGFEEAVDKKRITFYKKEKDKIIISKNHNWFFQVQGQLHITQKAKCVFGVWLGEGQPIHIDIIERDDTFWLDHMVTKLQNFYLNCMLPELIDPRHTRNLNIRNCASLEIKNIDNKDKAVEENLEKENSCHANSKEEGYKNHKRRKIMEEKSSEEEGQDKRDLSIIMRERSLNFNEF